MRSAFLSGRITRSRSRTHRASDDSANPAGRNAAAPAVDQRTRISHAGEVVHGKVVETVYAFDQQVIPAGSVATGRVKSIVPVSGLRRGMAYDN